MAFSRLRCRCALSRRAAPLALLVLLSALPAVASAQEAGPGSKPVKVAVIDVQRLLSESVRGQRVLDELRDLRQRKENERQQKQQAIKELQDRVAEGRLSLSDSKLAELEKELEDLVIAFDRFQDDAARELQKARDQRFQEIEKQVLPVISRVGQELGFTLIFNKFQSGLLYAVDEVDITGLVLERYDSAGSGGE